MVAIIPMSKLTDAAIGFGQIFSWMGWHAIEPAGPSFYRYLEFHPDGSITLEIGVPTDFQVESDHQFVTGTIPTGKYLSVLHSGDYSGLQSSTAFLLNWAKSNNYVFQNEENAESSVWTARLEWYQVGPTQEPDPADWKTKVSILLA
jgi:predicted transcriptional regulator YdeE